MANFNVKNHNEWTLLDDIALLTITQQTGQQFTFKVNKGAYLLAKHRQWFVDIKSSNLVYAATHHQGRLIYLHRALAILASPDVDPRKLVTDHVDRDTTNNLLSNLRLCSYSDNAKNCDRKPRAKKEAA